jgi:phosphoenolpyruvate-protein phosphotransferase/dihydroxyacetone kinase phosphotransfer subunit
VTVPVTGTVPCVGLVVVSHSRELAQAAIALAAQMVHGRPVRLEEAAGLDDGSFGTDAVRVAEAVARADAGAGVVVLMDLGSAVLSAELALDLLEGELRERVVLCAAPLVEGLVVAAVTASGGGSRAEVAAEAAGALAGKRAHLAPADAVAPQAATPEAEARGTFEITWPHGLHARPAAVLVQAASAVEADVRLRDVTLGSEPVPARSLSRVAALGAVRGHVLEVTASGPQAQVAVEQLLELAAQGFGDLAPAAPLPVAPGVAVGPAWLPVVAASRTSCEQPAGPADEEGERLRAALDAAVLDLRATRDRTARAAGAGEARIFDAHLALLGDPEVLERARAGIEAGGAAAAAWAAAIGAAEEAFAAAPDPYLRARAADVRAVGDLVLARLSGAPAPDLGTGRGVLVAPDLTPAQAAALDPARVVAVVLAGGSPTAHSAILTRALGIPTVVAAGPSVLAVAPGTLLAVDGSTGEVVVDPADGVRAAFETRARELAGRRTAARALGAVPAVTRDGVEVHVGANVSSLDDARAAAAAGADLAGLVRTEFLFLDRSAPPTADEQAEVYRALAEAMPGRRLVVRTLDIGGDKPVSYLPVPPEANPFLGVRGIRLSLARPGLLAEQLRAVVRVAHDLPLDVMFPMIATLGELRAARAALDEAVRAEGRGRPAGLRVGIMVEVPAAALNARAFAPHVDFVSVGTNDLTQYALAAERGNEAVAALADPLDPGVLALAGAACSAGTPVAVCGEVAADEQATALLLGLGVRELSVVPAAVATVKQAVRGVDLAAAAQLAARALAAPDAAAVRALLRP